MNPQGTLSVGDPVTLYRDVSRASRRRTASPSPARNARGAATAFVGDTSTSTDMNASRISFITNRRCRCALMYSTAGTDSPSDCRASVFEGARSLNIRAKSGSRTFPSS